jgi:predicted transcriptional regulator
MAEVLVGAKEIAALLGVTRQRVNRIVHTHSEFPRPMGELAAGRVWNRKDVIEWAKRTGRRVSPSSSKA